MKPHDFVIIGGGAGGLIVASVAGQLGLDVVLIEKQANLGGDCLHTGCVPSKALIHVAKTIQSARESSQFGLTFDENSIDFEAVMVHVKDTIAHIQHHDDPERFRSYGCDIVFGKAEFIDAHRVQVGETVYEAKKFVIATGSEPFIPDVPGLQDVDYLTNHNLFDLKTLPQRLVILGAGPIGIEMAQAFSRIGSEVTVLARGPEILSKEDPELAGRLREKMLSEGVDIRCNTALLSAEQQGELLTLKIEGETLEADALLVASGQTPSVYSLGLDKAGVVFDRHGINVDGRMRSSQKHIYACGDVAGPWHFTHMAEHQAGVVIANALFKVPKKVDYRAVPRVTYSDPEMASVGLTELEAKQQGVDYKILSFDLKEIDRAITDDTMEGKLKLVVKGKRLLGASVLAPHGGELIHELALAIQSKLPLSAISNTIHAYPTLAQVHRRAVNSAYTTTLFSSRTKSLVRFLNRWF